MTDRNKLDKIASELRKRILEVRKGFVDTANMIGEAESKLSRDQFEKLLRMLPDVVRVNMEPYREFSRGEISIEQLEEKVLDGMITFFEQGGKLQ